ncbi:MAG TPA: MerR family transcriptional regulator [Candidatus Goldiibacteriota bacterium]|nr:MerR family transcriptional regulator [Candidatus Goldiibacteriota bacterium]
MPETAIKDKPGLKKFKINQVAEILSVHQQTLRNWERHGLIKPERRGRVRIYSNEDLSLCEKIKTLSGKGVSLKGIKEVIVVTGQKQEIK